MKRTRHKRGRHFSTVAVDESTAERIGGLAEQLDMTKLDVVHRAVSLLAAAHAMPVPKSARYTGQGGRRPASIDADELIEKVRELANQLGKTPSAAEWDSEEGMPCCSKAAARRFGGSWTALLREAGLKHRPGRARRYSEEELISLLKSWYRRYGDSPTQSGWHAAHPDGPNEKVFANYFGTWNKALSAAGLPYRNNGFPARAPKGRNRQMVTGGRRDVGPTPWKPGAGVETIRKSA